MRDPVILKERHERNKQFRAEAIQQGHVRVCKDCREQKFIAHFIASPNCTGGTSNECVECFKKRHAAWREENREHVRKRSRTNRRNDRVYCEKRLKQNAQTRKSRLKKYGLTEAALTAMKDAQDKKCEICRVDFCLTPFGSSAPNIDHDHKTGFVRSILCTKCNRGLGFFCDDPAKLEAAAAYLRRHGK